ncbi:hypothetical protein BOX15_Mlig031801g3, partial [Macrostomum lignano]
AHKNGMPPIAKRKAKKRRLLCRGRPKGPMKRPRLEVFGLPLAGPSGRNSSEDSSDEEDCQEVVAAEWPVQLGQCLGGFRLESELDRKQNCCIAGCTLELSGPAKVPLCKLRCGLYELRPGSGALDSVCTGHAAAAAVGCELAASHGPGPAPAPEARVCLLCKCSCLTYGVACIRHSVPVPSGLFLNDCSGAGGSVRLCSSCAHVDAIESESGSATSATVFHFACRRCHSNLIGGGSLAIEQQLAGEAKDANEKDNSLLISSKLDVDDDEVGGYFAELPSSGVPAPPPPQPPVSLSADSLEASVLSEQRRRRRIQLARSFSAGLHAASRTDLERRLADRLLDLPDNVWDRHSTDCSATSTSGLAFGPGCRLFPDRLVSADFQSPLVALDGSVVELRPRLSERCPVVRLHLGGSVADYVELRLSADSGSGASLTVPLPAAVAEIACVYLRCLLGELPDLSLCGGVSGSGGRRRHSRRCQVLMLDRDAACCLACRRLAVQQRQVLTTADSTTATKDAAAPSCSSAPFLEPPVEPSLRRLRCLVDLCGRCSALEPGSDLCLLLGHSLKAALVARQGAQLAGARLPPLTCHSRVLQLAAGLLCTLGSRAYSLVTLNLPLGLPSAGELAGCHLSDDLLTVLRHRDQELESAKRSGFRVVDAGTAASQTVGSHNSTTVSNRRMSVKRVQVTIP